MYSVKSWSSLIYCTNNASHTYFFISKRTFHELLEKYQVIMLPTPITCSLRTVHAFTDEMLFRSRAYLLVIKLFMCLTEFQYVRLHDLVVQDTDARHKCGFPAPSYDQLKNMCDIGRYTDAEEEEILQRLLAPDTRESTVSRSDGEVVADAVPAVHALNCTAKVEMNPPSCDPSSADVKCVLPPNDAQDSSLCEPSDPNKKKPLSANKIGELLSVNKVSAR
jgi:hypothetical protein